MQTIHSIKKTKLNRRQLLRLAAGTWTGTMLAACVAPTAPAGTQSGEQEGAPASEVTLQIWTYPRTENDAEIVYKPMMEKFAQEHPDIEPVIEVQPWGGRREKLYAAAAANTPPDIWWATTDTVPAYIEKGVILPLSDLLTPEDLADYSEAEIEAASLDGKLYMPLTDSEVNGIGYSGGLLRELGYDPATAKFETWDELFTLGEQAKAKNWYLEAFDTFSWAEWLTWVHEAGGQVFADDRTRSLMTEQPAIDALTRWVTEYQNGWIPAEYAVGSQEEAEGLPSYWLSLEQVTQRTEDAACVQDVETSPDLEYIVGHPRHKDASIPAVSGIVSGQGWAITQQSPNKEAALTWVKFMIRPENIGMFASLAGSTPVGTKAKEDWQPAVCTSEHVDRFAPVLFAGVDTNTLWQEAKVVCAPHFQAALLGEETVDQALEAIDTELNALLAEKYSA
jgi:multiple sugar transport system substrate-binding protein